MCQNLLSLKVLVDANSSPESKQTSGITNRKIGYLRTIFVARHFKFTPHDEAYKCPVVIFGQ